MHLLQQCVSRGDPNPSSAITSNESVVAIVTVGCGCSLTTEKIASRSDIPVVSCIAPNTHSKSAIIAYN